MIPFLLLIPNCVAYDNDSKPLQINDKEKIAVINRCHYDLYNIYKMKFFPPLITANIMDPATKELIDSLHIKDINQRHQLYRFRQWAYKNISHTQSLEEFKDEKGKDPWGATNTGPTYKKLITSEMKAMYIYSEKQITGKCSSIVNLLVSMFRLLGIDSSNIVVLRIRGHSLGLIKIQSELYLIDNNAIQPVNNKILNLLVNETYYGLYNDRLSIKEIFRLNKGTLTSPGNLLDNLAEANKWNLKKHLHIPYDVIKYNLDRKETLFNKEEFKNNKWLTLAKYAYQSIYVKDPGIYLKASLKGPIVQNLATKLDTINNIFSWMNDNLKEKSIFRYERQRIMLADQVIVFKTGSAKDRGLLVSTLLKLKGYNPELILTHDNSYIKYNDKIIDIKNQKNINKLKLREILQVIR